MKEKQKKEIIAKKVHAEGHESEEKEELKRKREEVLVGGCEDGDENRYYELERKKGKQNWVCPKLHLNLLEF